MNSPSTTRNDDDVNNMSQSTPLLHTAGHSTTVEPHTIPSSIFTTTDPFRSPPDTSPSSMKLSADITAGMTPPASGESLNYNDILPAKQTFSPPSKAGQVGIRRTSRFDPMNRGEDDIDEEGYGDLGSRHPLRRSATAGDKESIAGMSLPSMKSLFGKLPDHPPTSNSSQPLFHSPSLPAIGPSSGRSTRYNSFASAHSDQPPSTPGWWAPPFDGSGHAASAPPERGYSWSSSPSSSRPSLVNPHSLPTHAGQYVDEHDEKRRRSDQPSSSYTDSEDAVRSRYAAQNRNASFPTAHQTSNPFPNQRHMSGNPPPPSASTGMGMFKSGKSPPAPQFSSPLSPHQEANEYPFERRPSVMRNGSVVGGMLAQSFADLQASEPSPKFERLPPSPMGPPEDRRPNTMQHNARPWTPDATLRLPHSAGSAGPSTPAGGLAHLPQPPLTAPIRSSSFHNDRIRRESMNRPSSPDAMGPMVRRSSLTEMIKANAGDDVAMASGRYSRPTSAIRPTTALGSPLPPPTPVSGLASRRLNPPSAIKMAQPSLSDSGIIITGWQPNGREPTTGPYTPEGRPGTGPQMMVSLNSDTDSPGQSSSRNRKRSSERLPHPGAQRANDGSAVMDEDVDMSGSHDPAMRGMDILAESARRVSEAEIRQNSAVPEGDGSPSKTPGGGTPGAGPKYTCNYCSKTFSRPSSLRIHTYSHTGERPFVCKEPSCRRRFSVQSNLKRHAKVHQMQHANQLANAQRLAGGGSNVHPPNYFASSHGQGQEGSPSRRTHPTVDEKEEWSGEEDELEEDELEDEGE